MNIERGVLKTDPRRWSAAALRAAAASCGVQPVYRSGPGALLDGTMAVDGAAGLTWQHMDARLLADAELRFAMPPGLTCILVDTGTLPLCLDGERPLVLGPGEALLVHNRDPWPLRRVLEAGVMLRKAVLRAEPGALRALLGDQPRAAPLLARTALLGPWQASAALCRRLAAFLEPTDGPCRRVRALAAAWGLLAEALDEALRRPAAEVVVPLHAPALRGVAARLRAEIERALAAAGPVTVERVAQAVGVSAVTARRVFARTHGIALGEYLRRRRLEGARQALLEGATVGEAARRAGYRHSANFIAAFRRTFGLTPEQWRARHAGGGAGGGISTRGR